MRSNRVVVFVLLHLLLLVGCGGGSGGGGVEVAGSGLGSPGPNSPNPNPPGPTQPNPTPGPVASGDVTFRFIHAQQPLEVPNSTVRLHFLFTDSADGEGRLVLEETRNFAPSITIEDVPVTARSVRVSALDGSGQALLSAVTDLTVQADQEVTVSFPPLVEVIVEELVIDPTSVELRVGAERQFSMLARYSDDSSRIPEGVAWSSQGSVLVDGDGRATAVSPGAGSVTVSFEGKSATATVTVLPALPDPPGERRLESLSLHPENLALDAGSEVDLVATGQFSNSYSRMLTNGGDGLIYESSNPSIATVDDFGRVRAVASGQATITASVGSIFDQVSVSVHPAGTDQRLVIDLRQTETPNYVSGSSAVRLAPNAVVTSGIMELSGGTLVIEGPIYSNNVVASLSASSSPSIGVVSGSGTSRLEIALDGSATAASVTEFIRGVTMSMNGPQDYEIFKITLTSGDGTMVEASAVFNLRAAEVLQLTVDPTSPRSTTNFHDPQEAFDFVGDYGADGSKVKLAAYDFTQQSSNAGSYDFYRTFPEFWTIAGPNEGRPIGTQAQPWGGEAVIRQLELDINATGTLRLDGLTLRSTQQNGFGSIWFGVRKELEIVNCRFLSLPARGNYAGEILQGKLTLRDCRFENLSEAFGIYSGATLDMRRCVVVNCNRGFYLNSGFQQSSQGVDIVIRDNVFSVSDRLFLVTANTNWSTDIANNDFGSTGVVVMDSLSVYPFDLRNNWWGQASGPQSGRLQSETSLTETISAPFLTVDPFPSLP